MEIELYQMVWIVGVIFLGSIIYSTFGFGDALFCMPLLSIIVGVKIATPLMTLNGLFLSSMLLLKYYRDTVPSDVLKLLLGTLVGIPIGIYFLKNGNELYIKLILSLLVIVVSIYNILKKKSNAILPRNYAYLFGVFAGILGGAFNISGPPIVIFNTYSSYTMLQFIANLQSYFVINDILLIISQSIVKIQTITTFKLFLFCLPFTYLATQIGVKIRKYIKDDYYKNYVYGLLIISNLVLFTSTFRMLNK